MSTGTDKARLQTLTDAIIAAQLAGQAIPPDERVVGCSFGEFPEGGWYWEITTQRNGLYGNTKRATTHKTADNRDFNMREIIATGMTALARESRKGVDHLHEAMQNDSKLVMPSEAARGKCVGCDRPTGAYHETTCRVAYS